MRGEGGGGGLGPGPGPAAEGEAQEAAGGLEMKFLTSSEITGFPK